MKIKNPKTINDHFNQKYGEVGSNSRETFEEKAQAFMIAELRCFHPLPFINIFRKPTLNLFRNLPLPTNQIHF